MDLDFFEVPLPSDEELRKEQARYGRKVADNEGKSWISSDNDSEEEGGEGRNTTNHSPQKQHRSSTFRLEETQQESEYREKELIAIGENLLDKKIMCTSCGKDLKRHVAECRVLFTHPVLGVLMCEECSSFYGSDSFSVDEDGSDKYCRWCGDGGQLYCCSFCNFAFCRLCMKRNLHRSILKDVEADDWQCLVCKPEPLWKLRALCAAAQKYTSTIYNIIERSNKLPNKSNLQERCSQRKNLKKQSPCSISSHSVHSDSEERAKSYKKGLLKKEENCQLSSDKNISDRHVVSRKKTTIKRLSRSEDTSSPKLCRRKAVEDSGEHMPSVRSNKSSESHDRSNGSVDGSSKGRSMKNSGESQILDKEFQSFDNAVDGDSLRVSRKSAKKACLWLQEACDSISRVSEFTSLQSHDLCTKEINIINMTDLKKVTEFVSKIQFMIKCSTKNLRLVSENLRSTYDSWLKKQMMRLTTADQDMIVEGREPELKRIGSTREESIAVNREKGRSSTASCVDMESMNGSDVDMEDTSKTKTSRVDQEEVNSSDNSESKSGLVGKTNVENRSKCSTVLPNRECYQMEVDDKTVQIVEHDTELQIKSKDTAEKILQSGDVLSRDRAGEILESGGDLSRHSVGEVLESGDVLSRDRAGEILESGGDLSRHSVEEVLESDDGLYKERVEEKFENDDLLSNNNIEEKFESDDVHSKDRIEKKLEKGDVLSKDEACKKSARGNFLSECEVRKIVESGNVLSKDKSGKKSESSDMSKDEADKKLDCSDVLPKGKAGKILENSDVASKDGAGKILERGGDRCEKLDNHGDVIKTMNKYKVKKEESCPFIEQNIEDSLTDKGEAIVEHESGMMTSASQGDVGVKAVIDSSDDTETVLNVSLKDKAIDSEISWCKSVKVMSSVQDYGDTDKFKLEEDYISDAETVKFNVSPKDSGSGSVVFVKDAKIEKELQEITFQDKKVLEGKKPYTNSLPHSDVFPTKEKPNIDPLLSTIDGCDISENEPKRVSAEYIDDALKARVVSLEGSSDELSGSSATWERKGRGDEKIVQKRKRGENDFQNTKRRRIEDNSTLDSSFRDLQDFESSGEKSIKPVMSNCKKTCLESYEDEKLRSVCVVLVEKMNGGGVGESFPEKNVISRKISLDNDNSDIERTRKEECEAAVAPGDKLEKDDCTALSPVGKYSDGHSDLEVSYKELSDKIICFREKLATTNEVKKE